MSFKDHFSRQATDYAKFRPQYPHALFEFIAAQAPNDELALDCATGNGQAAVALAEFFREVIGVDASAAQIESAQPNDRVEYRVAPAEATGLPSNSCDAMTVAQALHWFDLETFYAEAQRVLKPGGVLAVWAYNYLRVTPEVGAILRHFHDEVVGSVLAARAENGRVRLSRVALSVSGNREPAVSNRGAVDTGASARLSRNLVGDPSFHGRPGQGPSRSNRRGSRPRLGKRERAATRQLAPDNPDRPSITGRALRLPRIGNAATGAVALQFRPLMKSIVFRKLVLLQVNVLLIDFPLFDHEDPKHGRDARPSSSRTSTSRSRRQNKEDGPCDPPSLSVEQLLPSFCSAKLLRST